VTRAAFNCHVRSCYQYLLDTHLEEFEEAMDQMDETAIKPGGWSQTAFDGVVEKMRAERGSRMECKQPHGAPFVKTEAVPAVGKEKPRAVVNKGPETTILDSAVIAPIEHVLVAYYSSAMIKGQSKEDFMGVLVENLNHHMASECEGGVTLKAFTLPPSAAAPSPADDDPVSDGGSMHAGAPPASAGGQPGPAPPTPSASSTKPKPSRKRQKINRKKGQGADYLEENDYGKFDTTEGCMIAAESEFLRVMYDYCYKHSSSAFAHLMRGIVTPERFEARMRDRERDQNWWEAAAFNPSTQERLMVHIFITLCRESGDRGTSILNQIVNWIWEAWVNCPHPIGAVYNFISLLTSARHHKKGLPRVRVPAKLIALVMCGPDKRRWYAGRVDMVRWKEGDDDLGMVWLHDNINYEEYRDSKQKAATDIGAELKTVSLNLRRHGLQKVTFCGVDVIILDRRVVSVHPTLERNIGAASVRPRPPHETDKTFHTTAALTLATRGFLSRGVSRVSKEYFEAAERHAMEASAAVVGGSHLGVVVSTRQAGVVWAVGQAYAEALSTKTVLAAVEKIRKDAEELEPLGDDHDLSLEAYDAAFGTNLSEIFP